MSEESIAPQGEPTAIFQAEGEGPMSVTEATNAVVKAREAFSSEKKKPDETPSTPAAETPPVDENAALPDEAPGDATQADEAEAPELPPIDPPKSWTKAEKERFASLPRETQEYLADRESEREREFHQRQRSAAEKEKALEAEHAQTKQVRQQYETTLPNLLATMKSQIAGEFSDLKTWDDVEKLQAEDPFRYQRYDLAMKKAQAVQHELATVQQRQAVAMQQQWASFSQAEDAKFAELAPEAADPEKLKALQANVSKTLKDVGFKSEELGAAWEGKTGVSLRDHRVQLLIRDATLWREAKAKAHEVRQTPVPPVQKPGTVRSVKADANAAEIASITKQLETASGRKAIELATRLQGFKRAAR